MGTETKKSRSRSNGVVSVQQWAKAALHTVHLPSGATVKVRLPDLSTLLSGDVLPEKLRIVAMKQVAGELGKEMVSREGETEEFKLDLELMKDALELNRWLVLQCVVEPELNMEMLKDNLLPNEDLEMLTAIATRERDTDALGIRLGVDPLSRWETFRELHRCPEDCEACEKSRQAFSGSLLGGL